MPTCISRTTAVGRLALATAIVFFWGAAPRLVDAQAAAGAGGATIATFPDNEPFNCAQWAGTTAAAGSGAATAGSPRIILATDDLAVVALQVIDDWDETDRAKVNVIAGQVGVAGGAGASSALTIRTAAATNDPCQSSAVAKSSAVISATADTELVALSGSTVIYVCGFSFGLSGTTAPTARLIYGTGTTCATGLTALTGAYASGATAILVSSHGGNGTAVKGAAGNALCIDVEGTAPSAVGYLSYVQQ